MARRPKRQTAVHKATFFLSTGRCGTQWFARHLGEVYGDRAVVRHEPIFDDYYSKELLGVRSPEQLRDGGRLQRHIEWIAKQLETSDYIECGCQGFAALPYLAERFAGAVRVVHLTRHPVVSASSMMTHRCYSEARTEDNLNRKTMLTPTDSGVSFPEYRERWPTLSLFQKCLYFWGEVHALGLRWEKELGVPWCRISFEDIFEGDGLSALLRFLDLSERDDIKATLKKPFDRYQRKADQVWDPKEILALPEVANVARTLGYDPLDVDAGAIRNRYQGADVPAPPAAALLGRPVGNPRFFIVQGGLSDRAEHFYNETLGWKQACAARGIPVRLLVNQAAPEDVVDELDAIAACKFKPYVKLASEPGLMDLTSFIEMSAAYADALTRHLGDVTEDDVVVAPFATERDVYGTAQYLARIAPAKRPRVMFLFHHPDHEWVLKVTGELVKGDPSFCRYAARALGEVLGAERSWYCATNDALAKVMTEVMGVPFQSVPVPMFYGETAGAPSVPPSPARIGVLGGIRQEKGSAVLLAALAGFLQQRPDQSVFLQLANASQLAEVENGLPAHIRKGLTVHVGTLSREDFVAQLKALDLLLLPYLWQRYFFRISSLFAEATAFGIPAIVPDRTWMARMIEQGEGAGVVADMSTPQTIAEAMVRASDGVSAVKARAAATRDRWARTQSTDALVSYLVARARGALG